MASIDAKNVAREVLETVGKGKKVILGKIIKKNGYTQSTADSPKQVTNTQSYQGVVMPVVKKMEQERDRLVQALTKKKLSKEKYRDIVDGVDKLTKNIQLLSGGVTQRISIPISNEFVSDNNSHSQDSEAQKEG
jgi:ABC-type Mn2+/Zn2+ transport system ATPase subunit